MTIETILNTLNPWEDKKEIIRATEPMTLGKSPSENFNTFLLRSYITVKPLFRGSLYGAAVGALTSLITGENQIMHSMTIGAALDSLTYYPRAVFYALKKR